MIGEVKILVIFIKCKNFPFINQNWKNNLEVIIKKSKIFTLENNKVKIKLIHQ